MNTRRLCRLAFISISVALFAEDKVAEKLKPALDVITPDALLAHIKILASDEFEGRAPGGKGEELSIKYISDQFKAVGLKPGNPDGSYFQEVPLAGIKSDPRMQFIVNSKPPIDLKFADDFAASKRNQGRQFRHRFCRLRRGRAGIWLGRLQRRRCSRQNDFDADQRSGCAGSERSIQARRQHVQRESDDLLRPLDLQIRDRGPKRRSRSSHHSRSGAGCLSLASREVELVEGKLRAR